MKLRGFPGAVLVALILPAACLADEMSLETLLQRPRYRAVQLSPNGSYVAVVTRISGRDNLAVIDLNKREAKAVTGFSEADVVGYRWINNNRLLLTIGDALEASGLSRFYGWYAVNRDGAEGRRLTAGTLSFLGFTPGRDDEILVSTRWRTRASEDAYRLNTRTDHSSLLSFESPGDVQQWVVDHAGVPRVARTYAKGVHRIWYRAPDDTSWIKIDEGGDFGLHLRPLAFDYDDRTLYVANRSDGDKEAIQAYDTRSRKLGEIIAGSPQTDISTLIFSDAKRKLLGASYEADKPGVVWFDLDMARLQKSVDQSLPHTFNVVRVADENPRRALVFAYSDVDPGTYYLLDTEGLALEELFRARPWIDPKTMSERTPVRYAARDGLEIPAYLTVPKRADGRKPPLVVNIHGGPWVRGGTWGFSPLAQFFASRGYAVLEPEFRGSTGHGWKLLSSGFRQWGLAMQDDITDGVEWLIKQGVVDRDRICLYGGSYGGYATLWGLIKTPDLYRCGVAFVAVSDINLMFDITWSDMARSDYGWLDFGARNVIGDPDVDGEKFRSVSPLYKADKIKAPVLLAYGADDQRVPLKHGTEFRAALDKHGKTYEWVVYPGEGHGFNKDDNRFDFYRRVEKFLQKHLN